ncbi:hypothetical protein FJY68_12560 [candidate division WOR-3 bacterium]|uniref:Uncharacterized protein n=1 Tax=candidate division WOR-3 bacterium TaxID=2052148 RepID=A0A937XIJ0_UNCW3|nr:hypothetical protein [candidate division WOR-3 bacterium]
MNYLLDDKTRIREERTIASMCWAVLGILALASITVVGCGSGGRSNVEGKWFDSRACLKVEFFKDGTVNFTSYAGDDRNPDVFGGQYKLIDSRHMKLESPLLGTMSRPIACEILFSGRRADTLVVRLGANRELQLNRITAQEDSEIVGATGLVQAMIQVQVALEGCRDQNGCYAVQTLDSLSALGLRCPKNPYTGANYELNKDLFCLPAALPSSGLATDTLKEYELTSIADSALRWRTPGTIAVLGFTPTGGEPGPTEYAILSYGYDPDEPHGWHTPVGRRYCILHN